VALYLDSDSVVNQAILCSSEHRAWHRENGTYTFSHGLGVAIVGIGLLIALYPVKPDLSALGSCLLILMSCTTLSFLITTPEA
jgi:reactive chlorine resistance protein C